MKIKNLYFIYLLFFFLFSFLSAKTVDSSTSKTVAKNYFALKGQPILLTDDFDVVIENKFNQNITYYIYGFNDGGFVIVSGDDSTIPILGYSLKSKFQEDDIPPALQDLLNHYSEQINYAIESKTENLENLKLWNNLIDFESNSTYNSDINFYISSPADVNPLISTKWGQGNPYNALCPANTLVGCGAVAMAQIMKFWNHPTTGSGSHSYYHSTYGTLSANFGATTYNWSGMPNSISSNNNAIATLMYHCGVSLDTDYGVTGSSSSPSKVDDALINYFRYAQTAKLIWSGSYSSDGWRNKLKDELDATRPVKLSGYNSTNTSGHGFVCDGYSGDLFHMNWGWGGYYDGYYYINNLTPADRDYSYNQYALVGIKPKSGYVPPPPSDITPPAIPTGLSATAGDGYVSLSWNTNTEPDMKNYHIFRRTSPTGQEIYIASPPKSLTTYTDNSVTNGTTYYYQICAVDESDNRSQLCNMVSATPISNNPSKPTGLTATALPGAILLSWNANPESDITNYRIFKGTATSSILYFYSLSATETSFQDNNVEFGITYYYKINVKNDKGYYSPFSSIVSASPEILDVTPPSAPQNLSGYSDGSNIYLDWDDNTESDLNNYWVYRAIPGLAWNNYAYRGKTISNYTDGGVSLGTTYSYRISAVDNSSNESSYSNVVNIRHQYPRVAVNINSVWSGIDNNAIIDWDEHAEYWIDKYEIYRKTDQQTDFSLIITLNHPTSSYNDHNLVAGTTYYYKLKAIDLIGDISGESPRLSVKIFSPPTSIAFTVTIEEDGNYTFKSSDFSYNDADGHSFTGITITQSPSTNVNTIKYNQSNLYIGTTVSDFTNLRFSPTSDEFGSPYVKFKYKVTDSSGDISNSEYSVTINVTPINDLPTTFTLQTPTDNDKIIITKANLLNNYCEFKWTSSDDIEGDQILYNFIGTGALEFLSTQGLTVPEIKFDHTFICDNIETESVLSGTWTVEATDGIGITLAENGEITFIIDATQMVADKFALDQNFPNPFNTVTSISYDLLNDSKVSLDIYNLTGQHIITLVDELQEKGIKVVQWQGVDKLGRQVDSGIYFYKLQAEDFIQTRKMVLLK